ncbi:DUF998 domain-containing protein [Ornithinibacillus sp. L9]|uniref:DUF998 domain-containing protein n=1 Tax=Ornithinibacillus caprae TaxID=2678566 RepID=A0A6N8FH68_9BACI|nr:DUF998 domain-containing protein [Ornithinibacillus caprae]MUK88920.1 DUF998 domain-containing protein [Ornithinibacillus caprae]
MSSYFFIMSVLTVIVCFAAFLLRNKREITAKIGFISWISLSLYFIIEFIVIRASTVSYNLFTQPMSDLGVTSCGIDTYELANYEICSPYHLLMNWTFTITGIVIFVGAIFLHQFWPNKRQTRIATTLLAIFGLSFTISGIIPADIGFLWHTFGALPGMIVQIPALILIGRAIRHNMPRLSTWTFVCTLITTGSLILLFFQTIFIPGGLLQRILYGSVFLWMTVTAIVLWKKNN